MNGTVDVVIDAAAIGLMRVGPRTWYRVLSQSMTEGVVVWGAILGKRNCSSSRGEGRALELIFVLLPVPRRPPRVPTPIKSISATRHDLFCVCSRTFASFGDQGADSRLLRPADASENVPGVACVPPVLGAAPLQDHHHQRQEAARKAHQIRRELISPLYASSLGVS